MSDLRSEIISVIENSVASADDRELFRQPLVGFASAADPLFAEIPRLVGDCHLKPADFLPQAATVVSFFIPFSKKIVEGNRGKGPVSREWGVAYLKTNALINRTCELVVETVVDAGALAATVPATSSFDEKTLKAAWSHRSAAFVAGLGRFGLNHMLIGPSGGAGRYGTVFISPELQPSERSTEETCLYFKNTSCQVCLKVCPAEALAVDSFDNHKCYELVKANSEMLDLGQLCEVCGKCVVSGPCAYY